MISSYQRTPRVAFLFIVFVVLFAAMVPGTIVASSSSDQSAEPESKVSPEAGFPLRVVDDLGTELSLEARPASVISLSLFSDEVLFELADSDLFAAVTTLSIDPVYSNVAERAATVEPVIEFTTERIISLLPDLVIAADWSDADKIDQLRSAGIPVYQIATPFTLDGLVQKILRLGQLIGKKEQAASLVSNIEQRAASFRERAAAIPAAERRTAVEYSSWGTANGKDSTLQLVMDLAGVENLAARFEAGDFGQVAMGKERVVELDPDFLLLPGYVWSDPDGAQAFLETVRSDPAFSGLTAVEQDQLLLFPEHLKGTYSQYLLDAVEWLASQVYPDQQD